MNDPMKGLELKRLLLSIAATLAGFLCNPLPAAAADPVRFGLCYDLTKALSFITPQFAQRLLQDAKDSCQALMAAIEKRYANH